MINANRLGWVKGILLGLVLLAGPTGAAEAARCDIVVFLADDLSQLDCAAYGSTDVRTPNMQRLADAGLLFTRAFVASPSCAPSRAALLTGLMPARNGAEANHSRARAEVKKLPAVLKELGYEIAAFGKVAHYGDNQYYGFEQTQAERFHDHSGIQAAVDFLAKRAAAAEKKPLCLFVGTNWPHRPWPKETGGYEPEKVTLPPTQVDTPVTRAFRARYYNAITKCDDDLGAIYGAAQKYLGQETLFLFSSDHGAQWPFGKWNLYDAGIRAPLIVAWPGAVKAKTRTDAMVSWVDILPTLIEATGGKAPDGLDGRSFLGVLKGERQEHRERIFATHSGDKEMNVYPMRSVRTAQWKYIWNLHPEFQYTTHVDRAQAEDEVGYFRSWERAAAAGDAHAAAVLKRYRQRPADELYDLAADPNEMRNLAAESAHAARVKELRTELEEWMKQQQDQKKVFAKPVLLPKEGQ